MPIYSNLTNVYPDTIFDLQYICIKYSINKLLTLLFVLLL